jgi:hypothetical protein
LVIAPKKLFALYSASILSFLLYNNFLMLNLYLLTIVSLGLFLSITACCLFGFNENGREFYVSKLYFLI